MSPEAPEGYHDTVLAIGKRRYFGNKLVKIPISYYLLYDVPRELIENRYNYLNYLLRGFWSISDRYKSETFMMKYRYLSRVANSHREILDKFANNDNYMLRFDELHVIFGEAFDLEVLQDYVKCCLFPFMYRHFIDP